MEGDKRVKVVFDDERILEKWQKKEGLEKSWVLIKECNKTISDVSEYLFNVFQLNKTCPNGIILNMDGFVLPPFESSSILKDKDVIGVKRKGKLKSEITYVDDDENLIGNKEFVAKQNVLLLANEEFEKETGCYQSEPDEDEEVQQGQEGNQTGDGSYEEESPDRHKISKKRKASKKLGSSKKKKKRKSLMDNQVSEDDLYVVENVNNGFHAGECSGTKKKLSKVKKKRERASTPVSMESNDETSQPSPSPSPNRSTLIEQNDKKCEASSQVPDETEKKPSRSARRKKAKRQWLREIVKAEKEQLLSNLHLKKMEPPEIDVKKQSVEYQQQNQSYKVESELAPDIVPIVIRPGHIRFEPLEEGEDGLHQQHVSTEILQWNGITNKKKGQKWGNEKSTSWRNEVQSTQINIHPETMAIDEEKPPNDPIETMASEEVKPPNEPINFDNLAPLTRLPKEADIIAYRLVELSSTWTPELTAFRVGKTSWYDSVSNKILLRPLPEYPIVIEKLDEEDTFAQPPDNSFYKEDGSLEVDFSSLVDVRMVKESDSDPAKVTSGCDHVPLISNGNSLTSTPNGNCTHDSSPHSEKQENAWDEISEALNAKKAELMQDKSCMKENTGKSGCSYRVRRGSALGPVMARLRDNNEI